MVENNIMKCEEEEIDSLDVFSQNSNDDVFLDSLEPSLYKGKYESSVCPRNINFICIGII